MTPLEVVKAVIPSLSEKDKDEVRKVLGVLKPEVGATPDPCARTGHNLTLSVKTPRTFWRKARVTLFCKKCGVSQTRFL